MPGSRKCECGILGQCDDPTKWCNCDAGKYMEGMICDQCADGIDSGGIFRP